MAKKISERAMGIVVAVVGLIIVAAAIYFTSQLGGGGASDKDPPRNSILGPETVDATPATPSAGDATVQTALSDPQQGTIADIPVTVGPSAINIKTNYLQYIEKMPAGVAGDPVLAYLQNDANAYQRRIEANAKADYDRLIKAGEKPLPWEVAVEWEYTAKAGDIVSLAGIASEFTGGAHPVYYYDAHIANATTGNEIKLADMLKADKQPSPAIEIGVCEALKAEKKARIDSATIFDDPIVCAGANANAKVDQPAIALAPSNLPGKFGGLYVYYAPYTVGAYAEGSYTLTLQQSVFAEDLRPEYKALFAGEAPSLKN